jgi:hypothetical protein
MSPFLNAAWNTRDNRIVFRLRSGDVDAKKDLLLSVFQKAYNEGKS